MIERPLGSGPAAALLTAPSHRYAPLIIAVALFMSNLDGTVLATSLPAIATDMHLNPVHLKVALTSYLLALAIFIPASGWVADRLGARTVFRGALLVFALGSVACGLSQGLASLVAARVLQGIGGAMMVPVGRLVLLRITPKSELIATMAWLGVPALAAPILGPLVGGFITTYFDWRWNFWINLPVAIAGIALATVFIPEIKATERQRFDTLGFFLLGPGLAALLTGATLAGMGLVSALTLITLMTLGALLIVAYVRHAGRIEAPLIDLTLLAIPTFRVSLTSGFLFRVGIGATPFLLPLLFQAAFGLNPLQSGLLTFSIGVGSLSMKTVATRFLNRYGFRTVLIVNGLIASLLVAMPALFTATTPTLVIVSVLLVAGFSRSLQFTSLNAFAFADVPQAALGRATSFSAVVQELSGSVGVALAAIGLETEAMLLGGGDLNPTHFAAIFVLLGLISASAAFLVRPLPNTAGDTLIRVRASRLLDTPAEAAASTPKGVTS